MDQHGNLFNINPYTGKKKPVIFFYSRDGSLNSTKEACYFRDLSYLYEEADAVLIGNILKTPCYALQILTL
jgi:peroxiredoxin